MANDEYDVSARPPAVDSLPHLLTARLHSSSSRVPPGPVIVLRLPR